MTALLKTKIMDDMKATMKAQNKERLSVIRLIQAALKQREVDERIELSDEQIIATLDKMIKQRRESIAEFRNAKREDLATKEEFELSIIQEFMPTPLTLEELNTLIQQAIQTTAAQSIKDMGKVMGLLKPQIQGRADMNAVGAKIKECLGNG